MTERHHALNLALAGLAIFGAGLAGIGPAFADPGAPVPTPIPTYPVDPPPPPPLVSTNPMTPRQPAVPVESPPPPAAPVPVGDPAAPPPPGDPAAPPPAGDPAAPPPVPRPSVPEIQNQTYGSGKFGGGIFGTIMDLWNQAQNPSLAPGEGMGATVPPPGAGPAPALPPGYVSTSTPGAQAPAPSATAGGPSTGRPELPPGYYPIDGPPPPWYLNPEIPVPTPGS